MSYIQRLLDSAAAMPQPGTLPLAPAQVSSSPILAADQRLSIFPELMTPFAGVPDLGGGFTAGVGNLMAAGATGRGETSGASGGPGLSADSPGGAGATAPASRPRPDDTIAVPGGAPDLARSGAEARSSTRPVAAPSLSAPSGQKSALQRLVERDPLPDRRPKAAGPTASVRVGAADPVGSAAVTPVSRGNEAAPGKVAARADGRSDPSLFVIAPAEFVPEDDAAKPRPAGAATAALSTAPIEPAVRGPVPVDRASGPMAVQPPPDTGPSPFSRTRDVPPRPDPRDLSPVPSSQPPTRIIERLREVPVAPPAPPREMTASAQSVIGPLGSRRGPWTPRQEGV